MSGAGFELSQDLGWVPMSLVLVLVCATSLLLLRETRSMVRYAGLVFGSGLLATLTLAAAILRPARVDSVREAAKSRVVVLVDQAVRMGLPTESEQTRSVRAEEVLDRLGASLKNVHLTPFALGDSSSLSTLEEGHRGPPTLRSDLPRALEALRGEQGEPIGAVVLLSDGRLDAPSASATLSLEGLWGAGSQPRIPIHTVHLLEGPLRDRSVFAVRTPESVVAHEPFRMDIEVLCSGGANCQKVPVVVRELMQGSDATELGRIVAEGASGSPAVARGSITVALERAGPRVVEVALQTESGDRVPSNDVRLLEFQVRRDRLRILHVAGRPTYDVRALRTFLKSDKSIDLVAFFILRTSSDRVNASPSELALIPFPVDELFTEHLPSFDAVILQDIDAGEYGVSSHFRSLRDYVRSGGGLVLVGGPDSFAGGGYADSPLADVLPVEIPADKKSMDARAFVPEWTRAGSGAPLLAGLRDLVGERLPEMAGANLVGRARPGAYVLWQHPSITPPGSSPVDRMPILALGEVGDGRSIALAVDGTHQLRFGPVGVESGGRGHAALWEGMLGWLMRDPRFEVARIQAPWPCLRDFPFRIDVRPLPGTNEPVSLVVERLGSDAKIEPRLLEKTTVDGSLVSFDLLDLPVGGYAALVRVGKSPPSRFVFACEVGGAAWADSRPDVERLERLSEVSGGKSVSIDRLDELPEPDAHLVIAKSSSSPILPDVAWATVAAVLAVFHIWLRRLGGLL